jgi:hypothetical protein
MRSLSQISSLAESNNSFASNVNFFQPKLTVNSPHDEYEKEADEMAEKVMGMEKPFIQAKPLPVTSVQCKCAHCEEEEEKAQRKELNSNETTADHTLESYVGKLNGSGESLPGEVRSFYEPRFGYDFSNVKVHTDSVAAKSAQSINALAYTSGNNIVFNSEQYSPNTDSGKRLLGHELTHVIQQSTTSRIQRMPDQEDFFMGKPLVSGGDVLLQRQVGGGASGISAPSSHRNALGALTTMRNFKNADHILFDWWQNDCRDNDKNNMYDRSDPNERNEEGGGHSNRTYQGYYVLPGSNCYGDPLSRTSNLRHMVTTAPRRVEVTAAVKYRVCAELISQAYSPTGMRLTARVSEILHHVQTNRHWRWWRIASFRGPFIPGDLLFSFDGHHGHATMVTAVSAVPSNPVVIHLPGQSQLITNRQYHPTIPNDVQEEPWPTRRHQYGVGRYIG